MYSGQMTAYHFGKEFVMAESTVFNFDTDSLFNKIKDNCLFIGEYVVQIYEEFAGCLGSMFPDVVQENLHIWDVSPSLECIVSMDYVLSVARLFPDFVYALVFDYDDVRNLCAGAISFEKDLDNMGKNDRCNARGSMSECGNKGSSGCVDLSISSFLFDTWSYIFKVAVDRWNRLAGTNMCRAAHDKMEQFTDSDRDSVGIILSNYGYLFRALLCNVQFYDELVTLIIRMQNDYHVRS